MTQNTTSAKDPTCGMNVDQATALQAERDGQLSYFCSDHCRQEFLSNPAGVRTEHKAAAAFGF